jgi:hypothetical protein
VVAPLGDHRQEEGMRGLDFLVRFLSFAALCAIAGMLYLQFFHEGGRGRAPAAPVVNVSVPPKMAVSNAGDEPLKIAGEVIVARLPAAPPQRLKLSCKFTGNLVTQKPGVRLFGSGDWKPEREWPLEATIECETMEPTR